MPSSQQKDGENTNKLDKYIRRAEKDYILHSLVAYLFLKVTKWIRPCFPRIFLGIILFIGIYRRAYKRKGH